MLHAFRSGLLPITHHGTLMLRVSMFACRASLGRVWASALTLPLHQQLEMGKTAREEDSALNKRAAGGGEQDDCGVHCTNTRHELPCRQCGTVTI